jgi:succinate dehydrogenase/fumarate reductase flavoprotein subunit
MTFATDVLVIGSGAAGMYAAIEAARGGAQVLLADRSLIGRSGATVMAQMTVAAALGEEVPDDPAQHYADTIAAGRGLCDEKLAELLCTDAPACIRELDRWGVGWARKDGHITATTAPGHDRPRCVYVDFINTGPAVSKTLRAAITRRGKGIRKAGDLCIVDLIVGDGACIGALAYHIPTGAPVIIAATATVLATGGLTRLFRRNSASVNMGGDGYALALRAGVPLIDMEFVQFFPIGHLAPRLIGMDPIMWDPFRYKLGGRLLNGRMEEFTSAYGSDEDGKYVLTRDLATYAIFKEVEAGRGSPHGGAYLSFVHCTPSALRAAFGPVIDRLAANGIDLARGPVEVAPIAHYHMGGVKAGPDMSTEVPGLFVAGEVVGGAAGANRLSGNAITEALVFGRCAGRSAAASARRSAPSRPRRRDVRAAVALICGSRGGGVRLNTAAAIAQLQQTMADEAGPLRTAEKLQRALSRISAITDEVGEAPRASSAAPFDLQRLEWFDLRNMLTAARAIVECALNRTESRGAHQREDFAQMLPQWQRHQTVLWRDGGLRISDAPPAPTEAKDTRPHLISTVGQHVAILKIWRGAARDRGRWAHYEVPFEPGQSVLDALRWIRVNEDPTLAIRFSCINANACKECMIQVDGETVYACTARLEPREMTLTPLPNKSLLRDLVTDIAPPGERFNARFDPADAPQ